MRAIGEHLGLPLLDDASIVLGTRLHELPQHEHDSGHHPTQRVKVDTMASENTTEG